MAKGVYLDHEIRVLGSVADHSLRPLAVIWAVACSLASFVELLVTQRYHVEYALVEVDALCATSNLEHEVQRSRVCHSCGVFVSVSVDEVLLVLFSSEFNSTRLNRECM